MQQQLLQLQEQTPRTDKSEQRNRILSLLRSAESVTLPRILDLRIANYRARISELRQQGYDIQCETEWVNGIRHSVYRLR